MYHNQAKQKGNLLIMSVVVMVVVGYLSLNLFKVETSNHDTVSKEVLGTQAWFLAHSGAEWGLVQLFPLGISGADDSICDGIARYPEMVPKKSGCNTAPAVVCQKLGVSYNNEIIQYFKITSTVVCGTGINQVTRAQEVWAKEIE
ncbi:MSHA biogenesis protein MshP [Aliivibrio sp. S3MY1]|uniref:MSHA biogenesis protein MshP n=1 Tax=unclassified Aliivibrio TaxID=2645654 RepID=UPI0023782937|nr:MULTISPECIES: MSHA biogenesis protein MshP [unclassified Aliivibrio]MDD9197082.1 MSHA biogenesis protein MshP [Aliivibrio sp. S3MY1]MDD9200198.1 MSHA biogenesis protein MshP [Aliivibrio sp. S2MY1]